VTRSCRVTRHTSHITRHTMQDNAQLGQAGKTKVEADTDAHLMHKLNRRGRRWNKRQWKGSSCSWGRVHFTLMPSTSTIRGDDPGDKMLLSCKREVQGIV
jgi:hypothetical protein